MYFHLQEEKTVKIFTRVTYNYKFVCYTISPLHHNLLSKCIVGANFMNLSRKFKEIDGMLHIDVFTSINAQDAHFPVTYTNLNLDTKNTSFVDQSVPIFYF